MPAFRLAPEIRPARTPRTWSRGSPGRDTGCGKSWSYSPPVPSADLDDHEVPPIGRGGNVVDDHTSAHRLARGAWLLDPVGVAHPVDALGEDALALGGGAWDRVVPIVSDGEHQRVECCGGQRRAGGAAGPAGVADGADRAGVPDRDAR